MRRFAATSTWIKHNHHELSLNSFGDLLGGHLHTVIYGHPQLTTRAPRRFRAVLRVYFRLYLRICIAPARAVGERRAGDY
jgi:hypothetical protein